MCEFFMNDRKIWDEDKVLSTFNIGDTNAILKFESHETVLRTG